MRISLKEVTLQMIEVLFDNNQNIVSRVSSPGEKIGQ